MGFRGKANKYQRSRYRQPDTRGDWPYILFNYASEKGPPNVGLTSPPLSFSLGSVNNILSRYPLREDWVRLAGRETKVQAWTIATIELKRSVCFRWTPNVIGVYEQRRNVVIRLRRAYRSWLFDLHGATGTRWYHCWSTQKVQYGAISEPWRPQLCPCLAFPPWHVNCQRVNGDILETWDTMIPIP